MRAPSTQKALFSNCRALRRDGRDDQVSDTLRDMLRRNQLDSDGVMKAGRLLQKLESTRGKEACLRVTILGQCTTSWLVPALTALAHGRGQSLIVSEADYDNVVQGIFDLDPATDVVVFIPWSQRLLTDSERSAAERIDDELSFWQQVWTTAADRPDLQIVQIGYDWVDAGAHGHYLGSFVGGEIDVIRQLNARLRKNLPTGAYFVDLEQVSGMLGREHMYDRRSYFWTKQPFNEAGVVRLAEHVWAGIRAITTGPKKVLVLDLDNTLWGGVVGERGPLGIELGDTPAGEAFRDFQRLAKSLTERGRLLAVCSKNNLEDALEPFQKNPDMVLGLDDIAAFEASWTPKADVIRGIADTLRLGLDSFVFFDDDPAEREQVRQILPEVEVIDVPGDPADYREALLQGLWFESVSISKEDRQRTGQYRAEQERVQSQTSAVSVDDYLRSLDLTAEVGSVDETVFGRVVQLVGKTNQFNLTTRRHTPDSIRAMLAQQQTTTLTLNVRDRFGDYGLVAVIIAVANPRKPTDLRIDTWLMSCRVIGRSVEQFCFNEVLNQAREKGFSRLIGEYIPTRKNRQVADLYARLGFSRCDECDGPTHQFVLEISDAAPVLTFVTREK